jgi:ribosome maturation factor RimP
VEIVPNAMRPLTDAVREEITPLVHALGFTLIDVNVFRSKGARAVRLVIYRPEGVGIEDCAAVSRSVHPRLELVSELSGCSLEVSSPGIGRILKGPAEYEIFRGRGGAVLIEGRSEWLPGVIDGTAEGALVMKSEGKTVNIPFDKIKRVKLALVKEEENSHVL